MTNLLKLFFLTAGNLICITMVMAQTIYLEPISDDYHDSYQKKVRETLAPKVELVASAIVFPSFEPEWGFFLIQSKEGYEIFLTEAKIQMSENLKDIKTNHGLVTFHKILEKDVAEKIKIFWADQVRKCRIPEKPSQGLDGENYEFGVFVLGYGYLQAKAWSPQQGNPKKMADVTYFLKEFCKQENGEEYLKKIKAILK